MKASTKPIAFEPAIGYHLSWISGQIALKGRITKMDTKQPNEAPPIPSAEDLARLYQKAVASSDLRLAAVAEGAAMRLAFAESAFSEARTMHAFLRASSK